MGRTRHDAFPPLPLPDRFEPGRAKGAQLREVLATMITELAPGTLLPSERVLAERYGVARMTVRQEVNELVARGLIRRIRGAGSFVAEPRLTHGTTAGSFSSDMRARGLSPGARVLSVRQRPATALLAERLGLAEGAPVVEVHRVRTADGLPMAVELTHLPGARFPGLGDLIRDDVSLYQVLERRWGTRVARASHRVSAVSLDETDAALLDAPVGLPSFLVERTARVFSGEVVEWGRSRYRGDRYEVAFEVVPG